MQDPFIPYTRFQDLIRPYQILRPRRKGTIIRRAVSHEAHARHAGDSTRSRADL